MSFFAQKKPAALHLRPSQRPHPSGGQGDGKAVEDLYGYQQRIEKQQEAAKRAEETAQFAREHPVLSSVATVMASPFQAVDLLNMDWGKGKPGDVGYIPPDSSDMTLVNAIQTVRGTISHDLARNTDWELLGQNVPAFLYNTGMSMADSALAISMLGTGSVYLMGLNSAVNTAKEVVDNGGTTDQALKLGIAAGVAEVLFEKLSVEHLLKPKTARGWRDVLTKVLLTQGGIELSEEALTETANILAEMSILGRSSDYAKAVAGYRNQGASESEAKQKAFLDMAGRVGWAGAGGFLSGIGMGGGKAAVDYVSQQLSAGMQFTIPQREMANALPKMTMADFTDVNSPVWRNVEYEDKETQRQLTLTTHQQMVSEGRVVRISADTLAEVGQYYPDVRTMKRAEKNAVLKEKTLALKTALRQFLGKLKETSFDFEVNGSILEATLYGRGVREVTEKFTQDKASMLYHSAEIFRGAQYLYSTPDYDGDPNIYRWNYFYTPVQIGEEIMGVRIAVRDMARGQNMEPESQVYHWGIKKDTPVDGGGRGPKVASPHVSLGVSMDALVDGGGDGMSRKSPDVSLSVPKMSIPQTTTPVKPLTKTSAQLAREAQVLSDLPFVDLLGSYGRTGLTYLLESRRGDGITPQDLAEAYAEFYTVGFMGEPLHLDRLPAKAGPKARLLTTGERIQAYYNGVNDFQTIGQEGKVGGAMQSPGDAESADGVAGIQESEFDDKVRHVGKSILSAGRVTGFEGLTEDMRHAFREGLKTASPETQELLWQWKRKAQYRLAPSKRSYYRTSKGVITIGRNATASTVAHELFHWIDGGGHISSQLFEPLMQDYAALKMASEGSVKEYLIQRFPEMFKADNVLLQVRKMRPEYRGVADILNGLSGGKEYYGYGHSPKYWAKPGNVEAEAWAQFGRHQYENIDVVLEMFQELFPNFYRSAIIQLKELR